MLPFVLRVRSLGPTVVLRSEPESSSEVANLHGQKAKTPIIAGSICGAVMGLAWIIGFIIYFRKRYRRKRRERLAAEGKAEPDKKFTLQEKVIIPPDPAVLSGQHQPGEYLVPESKSRVPSRNPSAKNTPSVSRNASQKATTTPPAIEISEETVVPPTT